MQLPDIPGLTPEHLRQSSNLAHTLEGALLLAAALVAGVQASGRFRGGRREYVWPQLLITAGAFLLVYLPTHHGFSAIAPILRFAVTDAQQRQHFLLAALALGGGMAAYAARRRELRGERPVWFPFSAALVLIGVVFLLHPQHGTSEAVVRARALHLMIGICFVFTGAAHVLATRWPTSRSLALLWPMLLAATGVALATYREPGGAYETSPHGGEHSALKETSGAYLPVGVMYMKLNDPAPAAPSAAMAFQRTV